MWGETAIVSEQPRKPGIHPTAIVDSTAEIDPDAEIGPFCCIGAGVRIGSGTVLNARVDIVKNTTLGANCHVHSGAVIGGAPQDYKFGDEQSYVIIGDNNILREYVTIHRATGEGNVTRIGDHNMIMAYTHIGHNCDIGNHVTIASYVGVGGHVTIEDYATFGGICGVHQKTRIGTLAMVGGMSGVIQDVPPYMLLTGRPARVIGVNIHGLRRQGVPSKVRSEMNDACRFLYRSNLNQSQALEAIADNLPSSPQLEHLMNFIRASRGGVKGRGNDVSSNGAGASDGSLSDVSMDIPADIPIDVKANEDEE